MARWPQADSGAERTEPAGDDRLEMQNLPEEERTGYMGPQACSSKSEPVPNLLFKSSDTLH